MFKIDENNNDIFKSDKRDSGDSTSKLRRTLHNATANSNSNANTNCDATHARGPQQSGQQKTHTNRYSLFTVSKAISRANKQLSIITEAMEFGRDKQQDDVQFSKQAKLDELLGQQSLDACANDETEAELVASRQVISLLQRQIELLRVEKEGRDKLSKSQSAMLLVTSGDDIDELQQQTEKPFNSIDDDKTHGNQNDNSKDEVDENSDENHKSATNSNDEPAFIQYRKKLYKKDVELINYQSQVKELKNEKERQNLLIHSLEASNKKLQDKLTTMQEIVNMQEEKIASLVNYKYTHLNQNKGQALSGKSNTTTTNRRMSSFININTDSLNLTSKTSAISKLSENLEVAKEQNELLKAHIEALTERLAATERRENELKSECLELDAKCCQIQSKLLTLLKEIEQVLKQSSAQSSKPSNPNTTTKADSNDQPNDLSSNEAIKLLIKRLFEDKSIDIPLSWKEGDLKRKLSLRNNHNVNHNTNERKKSTYDELGFYISNDDDNDDENETINSNKNKSTDVLKLPSDNNIKASNSWTDTCDEDFESSLKNSRRKSSSTNKSLISVFNSNPLDSSKGNESHWRRRWDSFIKEIESSDLTTNREFKSLLRTGVPQDYRCKVWKAIINLKIGEERKSKGPNYYQNLLDDETNIKGKNQQPSNSAIKQIELDLLRTLPNNKHFETMQSSGTVRLKRVLEAYSKRNPKVGYCQGMNRLVAVALLILPEVEAFWCLTAIIEHIMPQNYYTDLWMAQIDSAVVIDYMSTKLTRLHEHFERYQVELSLFAWFLTIFVDGTPPVFYLRLWDCFLYEGDKVLFRTALAILKTTEHKLIRMKNSITVNNFLRSALMQPMNMDSFFDIVFQWTNPLSSKSLKAKRLYNQQLMKFSNNCERNSDSSFDDNS